MVDFKPGLHLLLISDDEEEVQQGEAKKIRIQNQREATDQKTLSVVLKAKGNSQSPDEGSKNTRKKRS